MFKKIVRKIVGDPTQRYLDSLKPIVNEVNALEPELEEVSDEELRAQTLVLKERLENGETIEDILVEAFALVKEASKRTTGLRHYDVQIMGGVLLHRNEVVEMRTGEGKTLVATLPLYLNALEGKGVHLVTVNDYLARRDGGWMGKIFHALGLTVGCIGPLQFSALFDPDYVNPGTELEDERLVHWRPCTRAEAYRADITYGISSEFGFDYLRDNMVRSPDQLVQRDLNYAIIDEADNVLIDEARTPLIISGPAHRSSEDYLRFAGYVRGLKRNEAEEDEEPDGHYDIDEKSRSISLTDIGIAEIEKRIPEIKEEEGDSLYDPRFFHLTYYVDNALKAEYMFKRDKQYVIQNNEVIIVDDFTGRLMPGRRYSDGLHEAIEAKEGVQVRRENVTVATITIQNYFRLYDKLAGMTGTALTDAEEFHEIYELDVTPLPTNVDYIVENGIRGLEERTRKVDNAEEVYYVEPQKPEQMVFARRVDFPDQVFSTLDSKDTAIINEIIRVRDTGRPILVGTTSVEHSESISRMLDKKGVDHSVLNAKQHQSEAWVVAQAGRSGAVTISTNMAGRGTDILLGGNPEGLSAEVLQKRLASRDDLARLAETLTTSGEKTALELTNKNAKLTPDMIEAMQDILADYEARLSDIEGGTLLEYLARSFQETYGTDYNDNMQVIRMVRAGNLADARDYLEGRDQDVALVEDAARLLDNYIRFRDAQGDPKLTAQFLADGLFDRVYNGRASLIRAVLNDDFEEAQELVKTVPGLPAEAHEWIKEIKDKTEAERKAVWQLGGLHVVGSERHESRRIDNQLRGRAARQGDPGSSRFFLSLEDDLMLRFGGERLRGFMNRTSFPEDIPIESGLLDRIIENSQERIEGYNFDIRKNVVEYDDVMSKQRRAIYGERRAILMGEEVDLDTRLMEAFERATDELVRNYLEDYPGYIQGEVQKAISNFSTDATDAINVMGVLVRMRALLPGVTQLDRETVLDASAGELEEQLMALADENLETGENLYQFIRAAGRFIPMLPPIPPLGEYLSNQKSGQLSMLRERVYRQFIAELESIYNDFLAEYIDETERAEIWQRSVDRIGRVFEQFKVEGQTLKAIEAQQTGFRRQMDEALRDLLMESLATFNTDQLAEAMANYVRRLNERWHEIMGDEDFRNFQRLLLLEAIDGEWRDYLIAIDDLRREIGLEAVAQRDPKVEYKRRSYQMFADMRSKIDETVVDNYFRRISGYQAYIREQEEQAMREARWIQEGYEVIKRQKAKGVQLRRDTRKIGRNDPCPCGSGKKYKHCHMRTDQAGTSAAKGGRKARVR